MRSRQELPCCSEPAQGGRGVSLTSSNTQVATVPQNAIVAAGQTTATFTVATASVAVSTPVTIAAWFFNERQAVLTVDPVGAPPPPPPPPPPPATDTVSIQVAEYSSGNRQLRVEATGSNASATLTAHVAATDALIGTLRNEGGGRYRADFSWSSNPVTIRVRSSLGGSATRSVTLK